MPSALAARTAHAVKWSALTTLSRFALQLGAQIVLARMLGPSRYGVYGLGIVVLTFAGFLAGTGLSYSLMLRERIDDNDIRFAFTWQVVAGLFCALAMALGAGALARFFSEPALAPTLRWLSLACVLTAASGTSLCLMQRALDFRSLGLIQVAAYAVGYLGVGLPLALAGWGAQALALACVAQAAVVMALSWWRQPHSLRPLLRHAQPGHTLGTGRTVFLTNLVNWLLANLDRLVIGRVLNAHAVGVYTLAWNMAQIPVTLMVGAVQPALLASGARLEGDTRRLAVAWEMVMAGVLVLMLPIAVALALVAPDLVRLVYGPDWQETGWVLALMCLCLPAWAAWGLSTPVLWNTGRSTQEALLQLPLLALALPTWWLLAPLGLPVAVGVVLVLVHLRALVIVDGSLRALGLGRASLRPLAWRGAVLAAACGSATWAAQLGVDVLEPALGPASGTLQAGAGLATGSLAALATGLLLARVAPDLIGPVASALLSRVLPFLAPARGRVAAAAGAPGGSA